MYNKIKNWLRARKERMKLENWYVVTWDDEYVYRDVSPPGKKSWTDKFKWNEIERICFNATDYLYPDEYIFFVSERPESYLIPSEAKGALKLWETVIKKGLFDAELSIKAATSPGGLFCWPSESS